MTISVTPIPRLTTFAAPALTLGTANAAGTAGTTIATDSTLLAFDTTVPASVAATAATGVAVVSARRDHVHTPYTNFVTVVKESTQSVNNTTTPVDDTVLKFAVGANEDWTFMVGAYMDETGATDADMDVKFVGPSGSSIVYGGHTINSNITDPGDVTRARFIGYSDGTVLATAGIDSSGTEKNFSIYMGSIINGSTAGTLQLQYAQNVARTHNSNMLAGTFIVGWKV
jgi:hypothetical protein